MILTRSKYYFSVTRPNIYVTSIDYTIQIGTGSTTSPSNFRTRELSVPNPTSAVGKSWINVDRMIKDEFIFSPLDFTGITADEIQASGTYQVLVATMTAEYIDSIGSNATPTSQKKIATPGYGYYEDGANYAPTKKILLTNTTYKADARGYFVVPLQCTTGDSNPTVDSVEVTLSFSDTNTNYVKYLIIYMPDYTSNITVEFEGESITIEPITECRFDVQAVQFVNRFGVIEIIHFYKAKQETAEFDRKTFYNNYFDGTSYNTEVHQYKNYDTQVKESFKVETGFLSEAYNATIRELLASEWVWCNGLPVNPKTGSQELKRQAIEKLITYELEFEYAYDKISTV